MTNAELNLALATYELTDDQRTARSLDFISGFLFNDKKSCVAVIEALPFAGAQALV